VPDCCACGATDGAHSPKHAWNDGGGSRQRTSDCVTHAAAIDGADSRRRTSDSPTFGASGDGADSRRRTSDSHSHGASGDGGGADWSSCGAIDDDGDHWPTLDDASGDDEDSHSYGANGDDAHSPTCASNDDGNHEPAKLGANDAYGDARYPSTCDSGACANAP
jgi:hypothetical protein